MRRKEFAFFSVNIVMPLLIGGLYYLIFGQDTHIYSWGQTIGMEVSKLAHADNQNPAWCVFVQNHFCDMLWAYALTIMVYLVREKKRHPFIRTMCECILFAVFYETLQFLGAVSGTFDIWDIFCEALAVAVACALLSRKDIRMHVKII